MWSAQDKRKLLNWSLNSMSQNENTKRIKETGVILWVKNDRPLCKLNKRKKYSNFKNQKQKGSYNKKQWGNPENHEDVP